MFCNQLSFIHRHVEINILAFDNACAVVVVVGVVKSKHTVFVIFAISLDRDCVYMIKGFHSLSIGKSELNRYLQMKLRMGTSLIF